MQTKVILEKPPEIPSRAEIFATLRKYQVPVHIWGTSNYRSLDDLLGYITKDRVHFRNGSTDNLIIDVHAVIVIVLHQHKKKWLELYEDHQLFPDGSILQRKNFNGIAETLRRNEALIKGVKRCLAEELRFHDHMLYELSECLNVEHRDPVPSEKWPGLMASYHRYVFECVISRKLYRSKGYVESEGNRTIFFKWKPRKQEQFKL